MNLRMDVGCSLVGHNHVSSPFMTLLVPPTLTDSTCSFLSWQTVEKDRKKSNPYHVEGNAAIFLSLPVTFFSRPEQLTVCTTHRHCFMVTLDDSSCQIYTSSFNATSHSHNEDCSEVCLFLTALLVEFQQGRSSLKWCIHLQFFLSKSQP